MSSGKFMKEAIKKLNNRGNMFSGNDEFSFIVMGDCRIGEKNNPDNPNGRENVDVYVELLKDITKMNDVMFINFGGDAYYSGGTIGNLNGFVEYTNNALGNNSNSIPLLFTIGNHDYLKTNTGPSSGNFVDIIGTPPNSSEPCGIIELRKHNTGIIALDTGYYLNSNGHECKLSSASINLLENLPNLIKAGYSYVISMHAPPAIGGGSFWQNSSISDHTLSKISTEQFMSYVNKYSNIISAVFLAHIHYFQVYNYHIADKIIPFILSGGAGAKMYDYKNVHHHFIKVTMNRTNHKIIRLQKFDLLDNPKNQLKLHDLVVGKDYSGL